MTLTKSLVTMNAERLLISSGRVDPTGVTSYDVTGLIQEGGSVARDEAQTESYAISDDTHTTLIDAHCKKIARGMSSRYVD